MTTNFSLTERPHLSQVTLGIGLTVKPLEFVLVRFKVQPIRLSASASAHSANLESQAAFNLVIHGLWVKRLLAITASDFTVGVLQVLPLDLKVMFSLCLIAVRVKESRVAGTED